MKRWFWIVGVVLVLGVAGALIRKFSSGGNSGGKYRTAKVERGEVVQTVRATGVVQPTLLVQVGTQVNGPITKLYVDYNDHVKEGQLVAQIDPIVYEARLAQDQANLAQAEAQVEEVQAKLVQARNELARSDKLAKRDMISTADLETATANRDALEAQLKVAKASVEQAKASLRLSKANLDYTTIRSPVNGVVIARNVSEGQTVVASMSAQVLFLIATDLQKMQVESSIPEADIGKIQMGQPVKFTVDAYDRSFRGKVSQIRLAAATVQNVVTYPVVISAENPDGKLFPSMTANITCEVARKRDALKVPNAALRFKPEGVPADKPAGDKGGPDKAAAEKAGTEKGSADKAPADKGDADKPASEKPSDGKLSGEKPEIEKSSDGKPSGDKAASGDRDRSRRSGGSERGGSGRSAGKVWIQKEPGVPLESVSVSLGVTDGTFTEVLEPTDLKEGQEIITGYVVPNSNNKQSDVVNPFAPPTPPGMRRAGR